MPLLKPRYPKLQTGQPTTNGIVGAYPFSEGAGSVLHDYSGHGNNGTIVGGAPWVVGSSGRALSLDGSTQYVNLGATLNYPALTYIATIRASSLANAYSSIIDRQDPVGANATEIFVKSNGTLAVYVVASGSVNYDGSGSHTLTTGKDYRIGFTYSSAAGLVGYVNAEVDATAAANGAAITTAYSTYIGASPHFAGRFFAGTVGNVLIAARAFTASEMRQDYLDAFRIYRQPQRRYVGSVAASTFTYFPLIQPDVAGLLRKAEMQGY